ncbi:MAG: hypothetical protein Fur003_5770 [Candidatus Dojkabacteria bacterium]
MFQALGVEVNILGLLLAIVVNMVVGTLWYGPVFGNYWLKLVEKKKENMKMQSSDIVYALGVAALMAVGLNSVLQFAKEVSNLEPFANVLLTPAMLTFTIMAPALVNQMI